MTSFDIRLNDFEGFDRFLFGDHKPDWGKYYKVLEDGSDEKVFFPPILRMLSSEVDYQINHYAMWMVIAAFGLSRKPRFVPYIDVPYGRCYACQYKDDYFFLETHCAINCPVSDGVDSGFCTKEYKQWTLRHDPHDPKIDPGLARAIARTPWKNFEEDEKEDEE